MIVAHRYEASMSSAHGLRQVGYFDCPGGGQIVVAGTTAFIGHMRAPAGTSIVDIADPAHPKLVARLEMPPGTHSHKVRVHDGLMLVNRERNGADKNVSPENFRGGLGIYDVTRPANPREITRWETDGMGVHRFDFDGRHAYISPTVAGYRGNIVMILDLADPSQPREVGRWWMPGQWTEGGEQPSWQGTAHRCHHPLRQGDRLYVSYWHGGFVILDIADMTKPRFVSSFDWSPPFACPTHTTLPLPFPLHGRRVMLVADEDVARTAPGPPACLWLVDITDERHPMPFASFQVDGLDDGTPQPEFTACHQPSEKVTGTVIPAAWFAHGLRLIDIADPRRPREIGHFLPEIPEGSQRVQSNDVTTDDRGLFYLLDRLRGLTILERC
jgi:hypothetical protein